MNRNIWLCYKYLFHDMRQDIIYLIQAPDGGQNKYGYTATRSIMEKPRAIRRVLEDLHKMLIHPV